MVLWEITLAAAYFLGLKRTYKLALKIQRKAISPRYPRIRQFAHRRTRDVFGVALKVYRNIQERDIEVGRNLGNRILRWLDRMKPSAEIRAKPSEIGKNVRKQISGSSSSSSHQTTPTSLQRNVSRTGDQESDKHFFTATRNLWRKPFPTTATMMQPSKQAGANSQYRHLSFYRPQGFRVSYGGLGYGGAIRKDMMQWMLQNQST